MEVNWFVWEHFYCPKRVSGRGQQKSVMSSFILSSFIHSFISFLSSPEIPACAIVLLDINSSKTLYSAPAT